MVNITPSYGELKMFKRNLSEKLAKALKRSPVVLLMGPRQSGKTTLMKEICKGYNYISFDDLRFLNAAKLDPMGFIKNLEKPVILDEVQRVPEIFLTIKQEVDNNRVSGQFALTGSAHPLLIPKLGDSLAGRMEILKLYPLSQGEINGIKENFIDASFLDLKISNLNPIKNLYNKILVGGYPTVQDIDQEDRDAWFESYVTTMLERDIKEISQISDIGDLHLLLSLLATRTSNLINISELSRASGIPHTTLSRYLDLLEIIFFISFQPAWSSNLTKRLVKSPKLLLVDSGLLCFLLGTNLSTKNHPILGQILENFVVNELKKQATWNQTRIKMFHFRSTSGTEVDIILEDYAGNLVGIEIKNSATVGPKDFKGLRALKDSVKNKLLKGFVIYTGDQIIPAGDNLFALPIYTLWKKY